MIPTRRIAALVLLGTLLSLLHGCGQKGALYREVPAAAPQVEQAVNDESDEQGREH